MSSTEELISHELHQVRHTNFEGYFDVKLTTLCYSLVSLLTLVRKWLVLENQLKMTSTEGLISHKLQQLRHPNFER